MCIVALNQLKSTHLQLKWPSIFSNVHNCTQPTQIRSSSIQMTLIPSKYAQLDSKTSNIIIFNSNDLEYTEIWTTTLNELKSTLSCSKYAFKHYKQWNQHLQPSNVHLYTYNALTSKHLNLQTPTDAPSMHQYTPPTWSFPKLLWVLKPLKIHCLTN